jgi:hypothetical protein
MSSSPSFTPAELATLRSWFDYSKVWGYDFYRTGQTNYEMDVHHLTHYAGVTTLSDIVFRNLSNLVNKGTIFVGHDVFGIAGKVHYTVLNFMEPITDPAGRPARLLRSYFEDVPDFERIITELNVEPTMSAPFKMIVLAAKAILAIAREPNAVEGYCKAIVSLHDEYEREWMAENAVDTAEDAIGDELIEQMIADEDEAHPNKRCRRGCIR